MSDGGLQSYGSTLKAFRRGVHQFPGAWKAVVVCANMPMMKIAFDEARAILEGGSLAVRDTNGATMSITTDKGGELQFISPGPWLLDRLKALEITHVIAVCEIPPETKDILVRHLRSPYVDQKYCTWQEATL